MMAAKPEPTSAELLADLLACLNQAEGACSQLIHATGQPVGFMQIRETLGLMKEMVGHLATQNILRDMPPIVMGKAE